MKKNKPLLILILFSGLLLGNGCNLIDPDVNISPNNPTDVPIALLLPSAQIGTFFVYGNDNARITSMLIQHSEGTDRSYITVSRYSITETEVSNSWSRAYTDALMDYYTILQKTEENPDDILRAYRGVAKVGMAMTLGVVTDLWNDIPYSEAFQGIENLKPAFDTQESIYNTIQTLLSDAIDDLNDGGGSRLPASDDLIYGGDLSNWIKAATTLKARYTIHLSKVNDNAHADALALLDTGGLTSTDEDANAYFGDTDVNGNFWYSFNFIQRAGYLSACQTLLDLLTTIDDPRIPFYFSPDIVGGISASMPGTSQQGRSTTGLGIADIDSPIPLVTYVEQKFIEAEAAFETGDKARAATAHNTAILAHIAQFGIEVDSTYVAEQASEDENSISLEKIMTHKHISLYTQIEAYTDWRRTNIPNLSVAANAVLTEIPRRLPYPQSERLYNGDNLPAGGISDRVWWDQ